MYAPQPPSSPGKKSPLAIGLLVTATILYGLSLLPWVLMLIMSPMLYDSPDNASTATLLLIGLLGWPVAILAGLIVGWWKRTVKVAAIAVAVPLVWALVIVAGVEVVNPKFFNLSDFVPAPVVLNQADQALAGVALGADPEAVVAALGAPEQARINGDAISPGEAVGATRSSDAALWEYPSRGLTLTWYSGVLAEVEAEAGWTGATPRGLKLGDLMERVTELYGSTDNVSTSTGPDGRSETHRFKGKGFTLIVMGDTSGRVDTIYVQSEN